MDMFWGLGNLALDESSGEGGGLKPFPLLSDFICLPHSHHWLNAQIFLWGFTVPLPFLVVVEGRHMTQVCSPWVSDGQGTPNGE